MQVYPLLLRAAAPSSSELVLPPPPHVVTKLNILEFDKELRSHPDRDRVKQLLLSLEQGLKVHYTGSRSGHWADNLPSARWYPQAITEALSSECEKGFMAGPFEGTPFPALHVSGLGVVPKKDGTWRTISHLSAPVNQSINEGIAKEDVGDTTHLWPLLLRCYRGYQQGLSWPKLILSLPLGNVQSTPQTGRC